MSNMSPLKHSHSPSSVSQSVAVSLSLGNLASASLTVAILPSVSAISHQESLRIGKEAMQRMCLRRSAASLSESSERESTSDFEAYSWERELMAKSEVCVQLSAEDESSRFFIILFFALRDTEDRVCELLP